MNAHYRFDAVQPGSYLLYAQTTIGESAYEWWAELAVKADAKYSVDLDNSAIALGNRRCAVK
jgi:hypothetical protein